MGTEVFIVQSWLSYRKRTQNKLGPYNCSQGCVGVKELIDMEELKESGASATFLCVQEVEKGCVYLLYLGGTLGNTYSALAI